MQSQLSAKGAAEAAPEANSGRGTLSIQLVDGFSREGIEGAEVRFGYKAEVTFDEPTFRHNDEVYRTVLSLRTDAQGWVMFENAYLWCGETCAICVTAKGYSPAFGRGRDVLTGDVMPVRPDDGVVAVALLVPEAPKLNEDFSVAVSAYLASLSSVRVQVLEGANFGNQSAAFALIQTLRLVGYKGSVRLLCDAAPRIEVQHIKAVFTFLAENDETSSREALQAELEKRIHAAYPGRVSFHAPADVTPPPPAFEEANPFGFDGPPTLDDLTRRIAEFKEGLLARFKSERDRAASIEPSTSARLLQACTIDLSDQPWPFALTELSTLIDDIVPLGLMAYEIREGAEVREAAGLATRREEGRVVPVALSVELTVRTRGDVSVMDKLRTLRPDLATAEDLKGVEWLSKARFDEDASADPTVLGFIPAGEDYSDTRLEKLQREVLKTGCMLALEPFSWFPEKRSMCLLQGKPEPLCLPRGASYQPALIGSERSEGAGKLIASLCAASKQASLTAPLTALFDLAAAKKVDLMTVYGLHQPKRSPASVVLNNLISALSSVQSRRGRKAVVLVIYARPDLASQINEANATQARYTAAAEALPRLDEAGRGEVLLIHAPLLPQPVFQLFCQASALPLLLEGANTTNLAQMLGLPYLSIASTDTDYVRLAGADCPDYRWLKRCEDELNQAPRAVLEGEEPRQTHLEAYLLDTLTHGRNALGGYFARLQRHVQRPAQNQVLLALYRLLKEMEARKQPPVAAEPRPILSVGELPDPSVAER